MRSPLVYLKNLIGNGLRKCRYGSRIRIAPVQSFSHLHTELRNGGSLKIDRYCQNRGHLYLIADGGRLTIGSHCFFNTGCCVTCMEKITIGDHCKFGNNLVIVDHDHNFREIDPEFVSAPVSVGDHTWVGANVTILRGTSIGKNCVIGAGSVVKGKIPDGTVLIQKRENRN
ncbi:MAG: acyltransferase [Lachnospiraceae bacterium]|nr:acyltransferase [Lachnospiraceae bacterium]